MTQEKKIDRPLTPEEETQLVEVRERWLGFGRCTGLVSDSSRARVEAIFQKMYKKAKLPLPEIRWYPSPMAGALAVLSMPGAKTAPLYAQQQKETNHQIIQKYSSLFHSQIEHKLLYAIGAKMSFVALIGAEIVDRVTSSSPPSTSTANTTLNLVIGSSNQSGTQMPNTILAACFGQHEAAVLSVFDFYNRIAKRGISIPFDSWIELAQQVGWFWTFESPPVVIVSERPVRITFDEEGELHTERGPAIEYADGFSVWAWHGERVPREMIEKPNQVGWSEIIQLTDAPLKNTCAEVKAYAWAEAGAGGEETKASAQERFEAARTTQKLGGVEALRDFVESDAPVSKFDSKPDSKSGQ